MSANRNMFNKLLRPVVLLLSLGWISYLLANIFDEHGAKYFVPENWYWLVVSTVLLTMSMFPNAAIFWKFLSRETLRQVPWKLGLLLHAKGQIVRYLPGRFWGLLYQINLTRGQIPSAVVTRANIDLMVISLAGNMLIPAAILCYFGAIPVWSCLAAAGTALVCLAILLKSNLFVILFKAILNNRYLPDKLSAFLYALTEIRLDKKLLVATPLMFIFSWLIYLPAWKTLSLAYPGLATMNYAVLCAWYSIAWLIGFAAAITPGGLGVREASFIALAQHGMDSGLLAFIAVIARLWLILADIIFLLAITLVLRPSTQNDESS